jgi:glycosyltransferase involved in cell wall biosynthesis
MKPKILIYGMGLWSHARVYWDLINNLSDKFNFTFINWSFDPNHYSFDNFADVYDAILIDMNSAQEAIDGAFSEKVLKKILPVCHGPQQVADYTFNTKQSRLKNFTNRELLFNDMDVFKKILCVSPNTIHAIKKEVPKISSKLILTQLGVDENNFPQSTFTRKSVNNLGYFTHFDSTQGQGMNTKRGHLAVTASELSEIPLIMRGDIPFQAMDLMYKQVDVYMMTSIYESGPLGLFEAGICGIPIIASPAGHAPQVLCNGGGVMTETFDEQEYIKMAVNVLKFWKENPDQLEKESTIIRENTLQNHTWNNVKHQWEKGIMEFVETK